MDAAIIVTYRCNARCRMCKTWQFPTKVDEEFTPELLRKLPDGLGRVNLTGGEPLLRKDLGEIVDIPAPRRTASKSASAVHSGFFAWMNATLHSKSSTDMLFQ